MLKHLVVAVVVAVCGSGFAGGFTGTADCGATVDIQPLSHGTRAALSRDEVKALESAYGGDLVFAQVDVDNANGRQSFEFYTICCHTAVGVNGSENVGYANLREVAKKNLSAGAAALFDDQKISAGSKGTFVLAWDKKAVKSLTSFSCITLARDIGGPIVQCH